MAVLESIAVEINRRRRSVNMQMQQFVFRWSSFAPNDNFLLVLVAGGE